jgi:hypothetical protein
MKETEIQNKEEVIKRLRRLVEIAEKRFASNPIRENRLSYNRLVGQLKRIENKTEK